MIWLAVYVAASIPLGLGLGRVMRAMDRQVPPPPSPPESGRRRHLHLV